MFSAWIEKRFIAGKYGLLLYCIKGVSPGCSLHGGNRAQEARRLGVRPDQILDASASLVPFAPPKQVRRYLIRAISGTSLRDYPDTSHHDFRQVVASWHGIEPAMIIPGNGASELFTWVARDASAQGVSGLPSPCFRDYVRALRCWNGLYRFHSLPIPWSNEYPQPFPLAIKSEVLWITNPHNPTGQLWTKDSLEKLLESYSLVICDEAFLPLVNGGESQSLVPLVIDHPNLVVIRSLTKLFSIAGLRLGYAIGDPNRLRKWQDWRDPWPINGLAMATGKMLMQDAVALKNWIIRVQNWIAKEGPWLYSQLATLPGITPQPSAANFLLIKGESSLQLLREQLAFQRILVRDCCSFEDLGDKWLRISLQDRRGNRKIVDTVRKLLD